MLGGFYDAARSRSSFFVLAWSSLLRYYQPPSISALSNLTFYQYEEMFAATRVLRSLINTGIAVVIGATTTVLLASIVSWLVVRRPSRVTRALNVLAFTPLAVPQVVVALAFFVLFLPTPLHGTLVVMILAYTLSLLAFTTRLMNAAMMQLDKSLEEVALTSGITPRISFLRVTLPLMFPALLNGWMWAAVHVMREFTIPLFLAGYSSPLIANVIFTQFSQGGTAGSSAPIVLLVGIALGMALLGQGALRKQLAPTSQ